MVNHCRTSITCQQKRLVSQCCVCSPCIQMRRDVVHRLLRGGTIHPPYTKLAAVAYGGWKRDHVIDHPLEIVGLWQRGPRIIPHRRVGAGADARDAHGADDVAALCLEVFDRGQDVAGAHRPRARRRRIRRSCCGHRRGLTQRGAHRMVTTQISRRFADMDAQPAIHHVNLKTATF